MAKPRSGRHVKGVGAALASTRRPVGDSAPLHPEVLPWTETSPTRARRRSGIDGLLNAISGAGTSRDKRSATGYIRCELGQQELDHIYSASWLAGNIVDIPAGDMVRAGWTRTWDGYDKDQDSVTKVCLAEKDFGVRSKFHEALKWARKDGGSAVVIGIRNENPSTPLNPNAIRKGALQYLHVLDRWRIYPSGKIDRDVNSPNLGNPLTYMIAESAVEVHWTRVIRFFGRRMPYFIRLHQNHWGDSVLIRIIEAVKNFEGGDAAVSALMQEAKVDVHFMEGLAELLSGENGDAKVQERLLISQVAKSVWQTLVLNGGAIGGTPGGGDRFEQKQVNFANIDKIQERLSVTVCGAARIPATILYGESPGGLNANGEHTEKNYYNSISADQEEGLAPQLNQLDQVLIPSILGVMPENYELSFNPLFQMDPVQRSTIDKTRMDTLVLGLKEGVWNEEFVARQVHADGTFSVMEESDVEWAKGVNAPDPDATDKPTPDDPSEPEEDDDPPPGDSGV